MKEETREWLEKAEEDFDIAKYNLEGGKYPAVAFYSQQSIEKMLKALQIEKLGKFDRTHDLVLLAKSVDAPAEIIEICEKINPFYVITCYPNAFFEYD